MTIYPDGTQSPASDAFDEAIELSLEDRPSPYPHFAAFVDTDDPRLERRIDGAHEEGYSAVLVSPDGSFQVLRPPASAPDPASAPLFRGGGRSERPTAPSRPAARG
jgi:hypothetical protein